MTKHGTTTTSASGNLIAGDLRSQWQAFVHELRDHAQRETADYMADPNNAHAPDRRKEDHPAWRAAVWIQAIFDPENQPNQFGIPSLTELERATAEIARLRDVATALVSRMEQIYETPEYQSVWTVSQLHVGPYQGPNWAKEFDGLRAALASSSKPEPTE